ncbi:MAG: bifunctional riboflavin kinase/FAD synthetase [Gammaproteobacteria bacterium]|nr:bifunctional riboflavin kinase/FAD synthetase [Gammaproteobacteria bacterium]NCF60270.1 bifunctional riboflavin kinase/FAD synthetase [Gammaproteobacteria bacterium]
MRHVQDLPYPDLDAGSVVTIGAYDGLHLGHQQLLERVIHVAEDKRLTAVVMSFEPTPKEFFGGSSPPARLMRFREKFESLEAHGIDLFYCPRFAAPMRDISAADFVRRILVHGLNARYLVVGDDFHFARRREGTIEHLNALAGVLDYDVEQVSSVVVNGIRVSSTAIRDALGSGDVETASKLLGRPYRMSGKIVKGDRVGRTLGYPTANVDLRRRQSAVMGIFAVRVHGLEGGPHDAVASVGSRPTFNGTKPILEVHLFDFDEDIYGEYIHIDFIAWLRDQVKFDLVEDLVAQMDVDADNAKTALAANA